MRLLRLPERAELSCVHQQDEQPAIQFSYQTYKTMNEELFTEFEIL